MKTVEYPALYYPQHQIHSPLSVYYVKQTLPTVICIIGSIITILGECWIIYQDIAVAGTTLAVWRTMLDVSLNVWCLISCIPPLIAALSSSVATYLAIHTYMVVALIINVTLGIVIQGVLFYFIPEATNQESMYGIIFGSIANCTILALVLVTFIFTLFLLNSSSLKSHFRPIYSYY